MGEGKELVIERGRYRRLFLSRNRREGPGIFLEEGLCIATYSAHVTFPRSMCPAFLPWCFYQLICTVLLPWPSTISSLLAMECENWKTWVPSVSILCPLLLGMWYQRMAFGDSQVIGKLQLMEKGENAKGLVSFCSSYIWESARKKNLFSCIPLSHSQILHTLKNQWYFFQNVPSAI